MGSGPVESWSNKVDQIPFQSPRQQQIGPVKRHPENLNVLSTRRTNGRVGTFGSILTHPTAAAVILRLSCSARVGT